MIAECRETYDLIPQEIKAPVVRLLVSLLTPIEPEIRRDHARDTANWWMSGYFHFGLAIRNQLRRNGFDAEYFGVNNLDDIYVFLVEEALKLR